ncbi:KR domain-containing protein, partial [Streptomyces eurythermus]
MNSRVCTSFRVAGSLPDGPKTCSRSRDPATGGLGRVLARHLVTAHGVRHLALLSRSGTA